MGKHVQKKEKKDNKRIVILICCLVFFIMLVLLLYRGLSITEARKAQQELYAQVLTSGKVDIPQLKEWNKDVVGWIDIDTLQIREPIVHGTDNAYYLEHSIYKKKQMLGTVFLDYKNQTDFSNTNTILYGKNIAKDLRFANLQQILEQSTKEDITIRVYLEKRTLEYTVFASYLTKDIESIRGNRVLDTTQKWEYTNQLQNTSTTEHTMPESKTGKILTLISYHNGLGKNIVVHALETTTNG